METATTPNVLTNDHGLLMLDGMALGYLMTFRDQGTYDATVGRVEITPEQAKTHNELLDQAMLQGLDENCEIGQGTTFYWDPIKTGPGSQKSGPVITWIGTHVSERVFTTWGKKYYVVEFHRKGKVFRGRRQRRSDWSSMFFKRIR